MSGTNKKVEETSDHTYDQINELVHDAHDVDNIKNDTVCHLYNNGEILISSGGKIYGSDFIVLKQYLLVDKDKFVFPMSDGDSTYAILEEEEALYLRDLMKEHWNED